jgi:hypothetical protein
VGIRRGDRTEECKYILYLYSAGHVCKVAGPTVWHSGRRALNMQDEVWEGAGGLEEDENDFAVASARCLRNSAGGNPVG